MPSRHEQWNIMTVPAPPEIYSARIYIIAAVASMGALLFGYDLAFIGTTITLKSFLRSFHLTDASESHLDAFAANIVSLLQAGCFFGGLAASPASDRLGRRPALLLAAFVFCIGSLMQAVSHGSVAVIFVGRAIGGLGVGAASMLVPLYVAELSPPAIRGRLVGLYELSVQTGTCLGFWICYGVQNGMASTEAQWITPFALQLIPGGLLFTGMLCVPESPRWTAGRHGREVALEKLARLRNLSPDHPYVREEMALIMEQIQLEHLANPGRRLTFTTKLLWQPSNRRRILIGVLIFIFMQMAGANAINYYSPKVFQSIGIHGSNTGLFATGIYGIVRLVAVTIAMNFFVDRFGRTKLLMGGGAVMAVGMWIIGAMVITSAGQSASDAISANGYVAIVFFYVSAVGYCFSYAGIPWIYCSEILPFGIRSIGMAIFTATHWLFNFVIARSTPYMISGIGGGTYLLFGGFITASIAFIFFCVPETKGVPLEQMDILFGASDVVPDIEQFSAHLKNEEKHDVAAHVE